MPHTIVFDTNYIKSFSPLDYLDGRLPRKMANQIDLAFHRGDLVALVETVRKETNAWLAGMLEEKQRDLSNALRLLIDAGYNITPATVNEKPLPDIATIMQASNKNVAILTPTIEDYREAERRTSYRLPPLPKNPDGEEMRDRVIWCQLVRYSVDGKNPVLIVARDKLFLNGSNSQEGKRFDVSCVEGEADLDQHLGQRPPHVQAVVDHVLHFALPLQERGIMLTADNILGIEELRNVRQADGSVSQRFSLITSVDSKVLSPATATLTLVGDEPVSLTVNTGEIVSVSMPPSNVENAAMTQLKNMHEQALAAEDLRRLVGDGS